MFFKKFFYDFQKDILKTFEEQRILGDKKIHIVAPPGSGKTIVGIEMLNRIGGNILILVPNITLQYQWRDKILNYFLEEGENIDKIVSTDINNIKKINIITYQALTQSGEGDDLIMEKILNEWYNDLKSEFNGFEEFILYIDGLKNNSKEEYTDNLKNYRKRLKTLDNVEGLLKTKTLDYFNKLKTFGINGIILDEAHHLTNWRSACVFHLWQSLGKPFLIGLTATPPFEDVDFYVLDNDYSNLLGEVDYYVPQPAIVKSGKLAPYQDLVYFVEPSNNINEKLNEYEKILDDFIQENKQNISEILFDYIKLNFEKLLNKKGELLINYIKFLHNFSNINISDYIFCEKILDEVNIEDIAKSVGKYIFNSSLQENDTGNIKKIFYNMGYIWRGNNFFKFRTPIEQQLIYSKTKIEGIFTILDKEILVLKDNLKCAVITDFLDKNENEYINCKYILKELNSKYSYLNPILVSGQGNFIINKDNEIEQIDKNILEITQSLGTGDIKIIIGTKGILGEGWDCKELNCLIDLTGVQAYMSVNQVRGRAIRTDPQNPNKVSNIYDVVCVGKGYKGDVDLKRLISKHEKFYGIDDTGLIIKGVNHIYPDLEENYKEHGKINENMLKRIGLRNYILNLWGINKSFLNKEIFGLNLHIENYGEIFPVFIGNFFDRLTLMKYFHFNKISELNNNFYLELLIRYIKFFLDNCLEVLKENNTLPQDFTYKVILSKENDIKIISDYKDEIVIKQFILYISRIFNVVSNQKYVIETTFLELKGDTFEEKKVHLGMGEELSKNLDFRQKFTKKIYTNLITTKNKFNANSLLMILSLYVLIFIILLISIFLYTGIFKGLIGFILILLFTTPINIFKKHNAKFLSYMNLNRKFFNYNQRFKISKFIYLNSKEIEKGDYIGKKPFITSKTEKLWI